MKISSQSEYEEFKRTLPEEMVGHPAFRMACDWKVDDYFSEGLTAEMELSEDKKSLFIRSSVKTYRNDSLPHSVKRGVDIVLEGNGMLSSTETYGELHDAVPYYQAVDSGHRNLSFGQYDSVLSTSYTHKVYDKNGIELSTSNYYKSGWGLTHVRYDDEREFGIQLFSSGFHKPRSWGYDGRPDVPQFSYGANVGGIVRDPVHPGLATLYSYKCGYNGFPEETRTFRAHVHGEWPDVLRVDHYEIFAEYKDGHYEVTDEFKRFYPDMSVEDIEKMEALYFVDALEGSKTKESNYGRYEALRAWTEEANKKYSEPESSMKLS